MIKTIFLSYALPVENFIFRRFYEYERQISEILNKRSDRVLPNVSKSAEEFFKEFLYSMVDSDQGLAVGAIRNGILFC